LALITIFLITTLVSPAIAVKENNTVIQTN
jgi:hypothetical protein